MSVDNLIAQMIAKFISCKNLVNLVQ